jgi:hypothetical protein
MNIDFKLLEEQRNHLLSILWDDDSCSMNPEIVLLDTELGWGIVHFLDALLDDNEKIT